MLLLSQVEMDWGRENLAKHSETGRGGEVQSTSCNPYTSSSSVTLPQSITSISVSVSVSFCRECTRTHTTTLRQRIFRCSSISVQRDPSNPKRDLFSYTYIYACRAEKHTCICVSSGKKYLN